MEWMTAQNHFMLKAMLSNKDKVAFQGTRGVAEEEDS